MLMMVSFSTPGDSQRNFACLNVSDLAGLHRPKVLDDLSRQCRVQVIQQSLHLSFVSHQAQAPVLLSHDQPSSFSAMASWRMASQFMIVTFWNVTRTGAAG